MPASPCILLVGTADTKSAELAFMRDCLQAQGATVLLMDVGVLAAGAVPVDIDRHSVAQAGGGTLEAAVASASEDSAMRLMARGAARLALGLQAEGRIHGRQAEGRIHGLLALGGSMGTDLALEVAAALPLGFPKVIVSTIAHSHLIPPDRITPDLIMLLWAGGLFGLNSLCRSALAQGCGAVVGAARAVQPPSGVAAVQPPSGSAAAPSPKHSIKPLIGITSLGSSCLSYMTTLVPALEARGYEVAVFHTTGMGGRAFETLAAAGRFAAVFDFSLQELANHVGGSVVSAGAGRLTGAARSGTPQIVAPGAVDMIDFPAWGAPPAAVAGRPAHQHNRLIASATSAPPLRRAIAAEICTRLAAAQGPSCLLLPLLGIQAWDRPGQPLHDDEGLQAFIQAMRQHLAPGTRCLELPAHINDAAFCQAALEVFDAWVAQGLVRAGH